MIINYWLLPLALLLLWFPRQWLRVGPKVLKKGRSRRAGELPEAEDAGLLWTKEFGKPRNWVDLLRAAIGAFAIAHVCFTRGDGADDSVTIIIPVIVSLLLISAVVIQTVRFESRLAMVAPVFFAIGLGFALIGWKAAFFATVAAWTFNRVLSGAPGFLAILAGLQLLFGFFLGSDGVVPVLISASLTFFPLVLSAVFRRPLVRLNKKNRASRA